MSPSKITDQRAKYRIGVDVGGEIKISKQMYSNNQQLTSVTRNQH
jgi:hypothetical protein